METFTYRILKVIFKRISKILFVLIFKLTRKKNLRFTELSGDKNFQQHYTLNRNTTMEYVKQKVKTYISQAFE